jgi:hypothetical protein
MVAMEVVVEGILVPEVAPARRAVVRLVHDHTHRMPVHEVREGHGSVAPVVVHLDMLRLARMAILLAMIVVRHRGRGP